MKSNRLKKAIRKKLQENKRTATVVMEEKRVKRKVSKKTGSSFAESFKSRVFKEEATTYGQLYNAFITNLVKFLESTKQNEKSLEHAEDLAYYLDGKNHKESVVALVSEFAEMLEDWENPNLRAGVERNMKNFIARV